MFDMEILQLFVLLGGVTDMPVDSEDLLDIQIDDQSTSSSFEVLRQESDLDETVGSRSHIFADFLVDGSGDTGLRLVDEVSWMSSVNRIIRTWYLSLTHDTQTKYVNHFFIVFEIHSYTTITNHLWSLYMNVFQIQWNKQYEQV